jgi:hypothetical protein
MIESPEAILLKYNPICPSSIKEPLIVNGTGGQATKIYDWTIEEPLDRIFIHVLGTQTIKYAMNQAGASADLFHDIIAGGVVADDGLGSTLEIDAKTIKLRDLYIFAAADYRCAVIKFYKNK